MVGAAVVHAHCQPDMSTTTRTTTRPEEAQVTPAPTLPKARTGISGLDEITGGGLPRNRPTLRQRLGVAVRPGWLPVARCADRPAAA